MLTDLYVPTYILSLNWINSSIDNKILIDYRKRFITNLKYWLEPILIWTSRLNESI